MGRKCAGRELTLLQKDREDDSAGGDGHLGRWLLPSVQESRWGPGRAGWARYSSTSLFWHRDETLHRTTRLHVALTHAHMRGDAYAHTHLALGQQPQSVSQGFNPADINAVIWHFAVLNICFTMFLACQWAFKSGFIEQEMHQSPCGLAKDQSCNTDRGNKSKLTKPSCLSQIKEVTLASSPKNTTPHTT